MILILQFDQTILFQHSIFRLNQLNIALKSLKNIGHSMSNAENTESAAVVASNDVDESSVVEVIDSAPAEEVNVLEIAAEIDARSEVEEEAEKIKSGEATPTNDNDAETQDEPLQVTEQAAEQEEQLSKAVAGLTLDLIKSVAEDAAAQAAAATAASDSKTAAIIKQYKQQDTTEREVPAFLNVKLKHVDKPPQDFFSD
jgi:FtsZ-interacting cell division protein ZipA